jgi:hypothetical protein
VVAAFTAGSTRDLSLGSGMPCPARGATWTLACFPASMAIARLASSIGL